MLWRCEVFLFLSDGVIFAKCQLLLICNGVLTSEGIYNCDIVILSSGGIAFHDSLVDLIGLYSSIKIRCDWVAAKWHSEIKYWSGMVQQCHGWLGAWQKLVKRRKISAFRFCFAESWPLSMSVQQFKKKSKRQFAISQRFPSKPKPTTWLLSSLSTGSSYDRQSTSLLLSITKSMIGILFFGVGTKVVIAIAKIGTEPILKMFLFFSTNELHSSTQSLSQ